MLGKLFKSVPVERGYGSTNWLSDVAKAAEVIRRGGFKGVTHGGVAHADDTIAAALLHRAGAEAIYRLNEAEEALAVEGEVVLFDIGDSFAARLPQRFVVLDHHGVGDPAEEPSSVVQVALAVGASPNPQVQTFVNFVDLFDRFGPSVKQWIGHFGNSLNKALSKYFESAAPAGRVWDEKFLSLVADAFYSRDVVSVATLIEVYDRVASALDLGDFIIQFPRTFQFFRLLHAASRSFDALLSEDAVRAGFGVDFAAYALAVVPELEHYILKGLESIVSEAVRAAEVAEGGRYVEVSGRAIAIAAEEDVSPSMLLNAILDLGRLHNVGPCELDTPSVRQCEVPVFVVVKDKRRRGTYTLWRPEKYGDAIDFRRLEGGAVEFKHPSGFLAVVKAESAEEAAKLALQFI